MTAIAVDIPLISLKGQQAEIGAEAKAAVARVLDSGVYILGPENKAFDSEFAQAVGAKYSLGVDSGTSALELALEAAGVGPGDEVIVPSFTFIATATAVSVLGAKPIFADIDPITMTLDSKSVEGACTPRTKAVVVVHLFGQPADMDPLLSLARSRNLAVIEDCAQSHLATYKGRPTGSIGDLGAFSFYPTKNLGAAGDAGAVTTNDARLRDAVNELRNCGRSAAAGYNHVRVGHNCRLDEVQAAILRVKLLRLEAWTAAGKPVVRGVSRVWSLERQVRFTAGTIVFVGAALAVAVSPAWLLLSGFVGAGLMFSAATDTCAMALVLARMPWNRGSGGSCGR